MAGNNLGKLYFGNYLGEDIYLEEHFVYDRDNGNRACISYGWLTNPTYTASIKALFLDDITNINNLSNSPFDRRQLYVIFDMFNQVNGLIEARDVLLKAGRISTQLNWTKVVHDEETASKLHRYSITILNAVWSYMENIVAS